MKKYVHLTLVLFIIAALSGFILGVVNDLTQGPIAAAEAKKLADGVKSIFEDVDSEALKNEDNIVTLTDKNLLEYYKIYDEDDELLGYVFKVDAPNPYKSLQFIVGINLDGEVTGVSFLAMEETPGLGTKVKDKSFYDQFTGVTEINDDIKIISGASKSSNAVKNGIDLALKYFNEHLAGGAQNE